MDVIIPTKDKRIKFMRMVYDWADLSKDPRTKIGAIIVKDDIPIGSGYNNFPRKVKDLKERYDNKEVKYQFVCHSELNSILNAARLGNSTLGTTLYTQGIPCCECAKAIINAGIIKVVCHGQWPNLFYSEHWVKSTNISKQMFEEAGVEIEWLNEELGMEGFLDGKLIKV